MDFVNSRICIPMHDYVSPPSVLNVCQHVSYVANSFNKLNLYKSMNMIFFSIQTSNVIYYTIVTFPIAWCLHIKSAQHSSH